MQEYRLKMDHVTKTFPGVIALDNVQLHVKVGSIHALIGENGAGKSTLMKCLFGLYKPDEGTIAIDGEEIRVMDTQAAIRYGISMIHQELNTIPYRTVTDNMWVGRYAKKGLFVDESLMYSKTKKLLMDLEFNINPKSLAKDLSVSQLQAVEIAKSISYDSKIIIMDEPTSSLTTTETQHLFKLMRQMRDAGRSVIYISHKLEEVFQIADEVTIMRDGKYVGNWDIKDISMDFMIKEMVGRSMDERFPSREQTSSDKIMMKVENLTSANTRSFSNISFDLYKGEILGIGGLVGAQRTELVESIFGLRAIASGSVTKDGKIIVNKTPKQAISNGFALVTEERRSTGIVPMRSILENTLIASYKKYASIFFRIIKMKKGKQAAESVCRSMNVRTPTMKTPIQNLSGGNQQKVLIARWLLTESDILILDEPTRGIDVGAKYEIYKIMRELVKKEKSIIMVSSEMPELIGMSDRILVMCNGQLTGILKHDDVSQVKIMQLATKFSQNGINNVAEGQ